MIYIYDVVLKFYYSSKLIPINRITNFVCQHRVYSVQTNVGGTK